MRFPPFVFLCLCVSLVASSNAEARRRNRKPTAQPTPTPTSIFDSPASPLPSSDRERILIAEDLRKEKDAFLLSAIQSSSESTAIAALQAIGRIGDPSAMEGITRILARKNRNVKKAAAFALGLIQNKSAIKELTQNVVLQKDPEVIAALLISVGRAGNEQSVNTISNALKEHTNPQVLDAGAHALGTLWSGGSEKWLVPDGLIENLTDLLKKPDPINLSAAFALSRFKGDPTLFPLDKIIEAGQSTTSSDVRALLCRVLGKTKAAKASHFLAQQVMLDTHLGTRIEAIKALAGHPLTEETQNAYKKAFASDSSSLLVQALESVGNHQVTALGLADTISGLYKSSPSLWVKSAALKALCRVQPSVGRQLASEIMKAPGSPLLSSAIAALGILGQSEDIEKLVPFITHSEIKVATEAVEATASLPEDKFTPPMKAALKQAVERADIAVSSLAVQVAERFKWKEFAPTIVAVYPLFSAPDQVEAKVALLDALGALGDASHEPFLEGLIDVNKEPQRLVIDAAVRALKRINEKKDFTNKIPLNSKIIAAPATWAEAQKAIRTRVVLQTTRGEIQLQMLPETPLNALNFVRLVKQDSLKQSFYNGKTFHRVVPNFVVQGGDPRGDGYGGPGYLVRDEVSNTLHARGIVGVATAGKDTGGCQFFINLAPNLHLDGRYTAFAKVIKGMEAAEKLEIGDRILTAKILP